MDPQQGPPPADHLIGQTIGNYLVTQKVGEGGMGSVYLAEHPQIGKKVALKVLHAEYSGNAEVAERFFHEAKAVNNIGHPNIVDIVDYGVIQSSIPGREQLVYFIMEYLPGATLSQLIRAEAPLPPERAMSIAMQVADALAASHKMGIIHRDLKPDNIMLAQRGRERDFVKLLDFGIAKLGGDSTGTHKTRTQMVMGTPAYMSPEQCEGKAATADGRTDIYSLGIVLYEMLTGRVPFIAEDYGGILIQHMAHRPVPPSQYRMMPPHVEVVVLKALEKRPDMRYPTMDEFMRALADPVGFVEAHGGPGQFLQRQLMPSNAPLPSVRLTPSPFTPAPGTLGSPSGIYPPPHSPSGIYPPTTPAPTTLGAAAGEVQPRRSKVGFVIAAVLVLAAAGIGIGVVVNGNKTEGGGEVTGTDPGSDTGSSKVGGPGPAVGSNGSGEKTVERGSAGSATEPVGSGGGSAIVQQVGSGSGSATEPVGVGSGSGSASAVVPLRSVITLTSTPSGAAIWLDGKDTGKKTPSEIEIESAKRTATFTLKLAGHTDVVLKKLDVTKDVTRPVTLQKKKTGTTNPGRGSGSGRKDDTTLERPE